MGRSSAGPGFGGTEEQPPIPTVTGKIRYKKPIMVDDFAFLKKETKKTASPRPDLQGFSVVLLLGDMQAGPAAESLSPAARKALAGVGAWAGPEQASGCSQLASQRGGGNGSPDIVSVAPREGLGVAVGAAGGDMGTAPPRVEKWSTRSGRPHARGPPSRRRQAGGSRVIRPESPAPLAKALRRARIVLTGHASPLAS